MYYDHVVDLANLYSCFSATVVINDKLYEGLSNEPTTLEVLILYFELLY